MLIPDRITPASPTTAHGRTPSRSTRVGHRLDREWRRLRHDRRALRQIAQWRTGNPTVGSGDSGGSVGASGAAPGAPGVRAAEGDVLGVAIDRAMSWRDLEVILAATHRDTCADHDPVLRRLVGLAAADPLAGRIVLQRLLPGLLAAAERYHRAWDGDDVLDQVVAAAWIAIRMFDLSRRRGPVAPSLISDAMSIGYRNALRRQAAHPELPSDPAEWARHAAPTDRTALEELAGIVREAHDRGVPDCDLELVRHLVSSGSPGRVAAEREVTARTVRNHRDRAIANIRRAVLEAA